MLIVTNFQTKANHAPIFRTTRLTHHATLNATLHRHLGAGAAAAQRPQRQAHQQGGLPRVPAARRLLPAEAGQQHRDAAIPGSHF